MTSTGSLAPLLTIMLSASASPVSAGAKPAGATVRYMCAADKQFTVSRTASAALVRSAEGSLRLIRGSSSIGQRYSAPQATLIIDGDFASLVWRGASRFRNCHAMRNLAGSG